MTYDAIVIGSGPAGYLAAERLGQGGKQALLVEREEHLGGVCLNWGCIPTKTLLACAKAYYTATHGEDFGVAVEGASFQLEKAMARKLAVQKPLRQGIRGLMKKYGVEVVRGEARCTAPGTVVVGEETYQAEHVLVCTGSRPATPPIPGADLPHVLDSTGILEIERLPEHLVVIGGGVIGVEFACFFASVGVPVTVIELFEQIVPGIDPDLAKVLRGELERKGVQFSTGSKVTAIEREAVRYTDAAGAGHSAAADTVLLCTGRVPNVEGLGLEDLGVEVTRRGIVADAQGRTSVPGLWACGDVTGRIMLAHAASAQAEATVATILGRRAAYRERTVASVIYTSPEVAAVGMSAAAAEAAGIEHLVASWPLQANGRFLAEQGGKGLIKVVARKDDRRLLGVHIVGGPAGEMIHDAVSLIERDATLEEIRDSIFPHPTISEALRDAALAAG